MGKFATKVASETGDVLVGRAPLAAVEFGRLEKQAVKETLGVGQIFGPTALRMPAKEHTVPDMQESEVQP